MALDEAFAGLLRSSRKRATFVGACLAGVAFCAVCGVSEFITGNPITFIVGNTKDLQQNYQML
ncbi:hypothetical protein JHW44_06290 [Paracoccus seriniphilus]|nr:hypothetical protein JHW44_06290 [Paracoccus seriniphilus]